MPTPGPEGLKLGPWRPKPSLKRSKPGFGGPKLSPGRPLPSNGRPKPGPIGPSQTQGGLGQTFLLGPCKIWLRPLDQASEGNGQAFLGLVQASQRGKTCRKADRATDRNSPLCSIGLCPLWGHCPAGNSFRGSIGQVIHQSLIQ